VAELPEGKTKLIQYLNEANGLERRETALQAHLELAPRSGVRYSESKFQRPPLKKRNIHG
jgi:hypothetical protein